MNLKTFISKNVVSSSYIPDTSIKITYSDNNICVKAIATKTISIGSIYVKYACTRNTSSVDIYIEAIMYFDSASIKATNIKNADIRVICVANA